MGIQVAGWYEVMHLQASVGAVARRWCLSGLVVMTSFELSQMAATLEATPTPLPTTAVCDVTPRSVAEIIALIDPASAAGRPIRALPAGEPADAATYQAIAAAVRQLEACLNSGDWHRVFALYSDDWIRQNMGGDQRELVGVLETTTPTPVAKGKRAAFIGPWDVQILPDHRVLAAYVFRSEDEPNPDPSRTKVLVFVHHDGRWLIDEIIGEVMISECDFPLDVAVVVGPPPGATLTPPPQTCGGQDHPNKKQKKRRERPPEANDPTGDVTTSPSPVAAN